MGQLECDRQVVLPDPSSAFSLSNAFYGLFAGWMRDINPVDLGGWRHRFLFENIGTVNFAQNLWCWKGKRKKNMHYTYCMSCFSINLMFLVWQPGILCTALSHMCQIITVIKDGRINAFFAAKHWNSVTYYIRWSKCFLFVGHEEHMETFRAE